MEKKWYHFGRKEEKRQQTLEEILLQGYLNQNIVSKDECLAIPSVTGCVDAICSTIASLPIKLYKATEGKVEEMEDDRVTLLNDDTGDLLTGWEFKRAILEDMLLEGSGYAYINRVRNTVRSLHYVKHESVSVTMGTDPVFKEYTVNINGLDYRDFELLKVTRKSRNGVTGKGIVEENNKMLSVAYATMLYEDALVRTGGNKRGFLKATGRLSPESIAELKAAWKNLYSNATDSNVIVLNNGLEFQESTISSVEMQMNENKRTNSDEVCKMFLVPPTILDGSAKDEEYGNWIKTCLTPIMAAFETSLNRELLLPSEKKEGHYFAFDTTQLVKSSIKERYAAYSEAIKGGWISKNEVRYIENFEKIEGLDIVTMSLGDIIYDIDKGSFYIPNTDTMISKDGQATTGAGQPDTQFKNNAAPLDKPADPKKAGDENVQ